MTKKEAVTVLASEIYRDIGDGSLKKVQVKGAVKAACENNSPELIKNLYSYYEQQGCTYEAALHCMKLLLGKSLIMPSAKPSSWLTDTAPVEAEGHT